MDKKNHPPAGGPITNFAPVVSVLGHVDHGKTSLLDKIRSSTHAVREKGGITQKIGASEIEIKHEGKIRKITFIDTPGHEAFANMRSQGVSAADIVLLIIGADDGIMPQTKESIAKILEAKVPFIVVFTKTDLETANVDKVRQQVLKEGILLEGLGGDVPYIGVSSKTGENIQELLDLIVLVYDLSNIKKSEQDTFLGVVIDSKQDKRRGVVATAVVKSGTISISKPLYVHGKQIGKVRALTGASGKVVRDAVPGDAVEILGATDVLPAGSVLFDREVEPKVLPETKPAVTSEKDIMAFLQEDKKDFVAVILKTESAAELEALKGSLPVKVKVIYEGQGDIVTSDILMAKDFRALVLGFNVDITREAKELAEGDKVFYKTYDIIYHLLEELETLIETLEKGEVEKELGRGQILASFLGTTQVIIGLKVTAGRLAVGDRIKVLRGEKELGSSKVVSVRHGKGDIKVAEKNSECGIVIDPQIDFVPGDVIIAYSKS